MEKTRIKLYRHNGEYVRSKMVSGTPTWNDAKELLRGYFGDIHCHMDIAVYDDYNDTPGECVLKLSTPAGQKFSVRWKQ